MYGARKEPAVNPPLIVIDPDPTFLRFLFRILLDFQKVPNLSLNIYSYSIPMIFESLNGCIDHNF
jgi:hypothetical protein